MLLSAWPHLIHAILKTNRFATSTPYLYSLKFDHSLRVKYKTDEWGAYFSECGTIRYLSCTIHDGFSWPVFVALEISGNLMLLRGLIFMSCLVLLSRKVNCIIIFGFYLFINMGVWVILNASWLILHALELTTL
jgi:hypothetical protein